ncbi:MAG TPA: hypothetical protein QGH10_16530 [Armatimonadota bacterium]|nr:hypothetical protein [Armatimonadota bacterium]
MTVIAQLLMAATAMAATPQETVDLLHRQTKPEHAHALIDAGATAEINGVLTSNGNGAYVMAYVLAQRPVEGTREALEVALTSGDQRVGYWSAMALGKLGDAESAPALVAAMPTVDEPKAYWDLARWTPERWITQFGRKNVDGVVEITEAPEGYANIRVAYAALEALGMVGGDPAAETLTKYLASDQWLIRYGSVRGLGNMAHRPAAETIRQMKEADPTLVVRKAAKKALLQIAGIEIHAPDRGEVDVPAIAFIKTQARTESALGFQDSYNYPTMPWYQWGQNIYTLTPPTADGELVNLTEFEHHRVQGLEASYDGERLLFAMCDDDAETGFHVCEINADGTGFRELTSGNCNDVDPFYMPDGRIVFISDRSGHHEYYHQERSRSVYVMDADGSNIQRLTYNPNQDYAPYVLSNGMITYTSYRFYGQDGSGNVFGRGSDLSRIETQLRAINPDGTGDHLVYGAMRGGFYVPLRPMADSLQNSGSNFQRGTDQHIGVSVSWVRELPDGRLVCVTPAGLTLLDPAVDGLSIETPFFPEVINLAGGEQVYIFSHDELNPVGRYTSPYPADAGRLFVSHAPFYDLGFNAYGLYLFDMDTREMTLIHDEPGVSDVDPVALMPRPRPHRLEPADPVKRQETGTILCMSAFNSDIEFPKELARYVRVVGVTLMGQTINANAAFESHVLGTAPLQADGSFKVEVPADRPVRFQLLDEDGNILLHETAFNYVRGGETLTCVGCHEPKGQTPSQVLPLAAKLDAFPTLESVGNLRYHGRVWRSYNHIARP